MERSPFRIFGLDKSFNGHSELDCVTETKPDAPIYLRIDESQEPTDARRHRKHVDRRVNVRLKDVLPLFVEASAKHRMWLDDFGDDQLSISNDLYEILLAYRAMQRAA